MRVVGDLVNGKTTLGMSVRPQKIINLRVVSPAPRQMTIEQVHPKVGNSQCASFDHKFRRHTFRIITLLKCHSPLKAVIRRINFELADLLSLV